MPADIRQNSLLACLPHEDLAVLSPKLSLVDVPRGALLRESGQRVEWTYFPLSGLISVVGGDGDGDAVDVAVVGRGGVLDPLAAIVETPMPTEAVQQISGWAARMPAAEFREAVSRVAALRQVIDRYLAALFIEVAQGSACNRLHSLEARTARWLLLTADHVGDDSLELTHELLALMVGGSRPKLTQRVGEFSRAGLVASGRNTIRILDRSGLAARSCDCYGVIRGAHENIFAP